MKKRQNIDLETTRYGLFMSENSFNLDIMYGREFLIKDNVQIVTLYRINILETKAHKLYGQTKPSDKKFMTPVVLNVTVNIEESDQKLYGNGDSGITRDDTGNLKVGVYLQELQEKNTEINRGDILMYNMSGTKNRYYEVISANNVTDTTKKTIGGFKPYYKTITAIPVKEDVVNLLSDVI
jgi:hypothetical protein